jgi:uncharacterized protein
MHQKNKDFYNHYIRLRNKIDTLSQKLEKEHKTHMVCKKGCDLCCMDYNIFPVEFYAILDELKAKGFSPEPVENKDENACVFLKNHQCAIYDSRPVICRTHGIPLLFANDESEWELSACELNFTEFDFEDFTFENTFPQDKFNSKLFILNKEFINEWKDKKYEMLDLIPLKDLVKHF